MMLLAVLWTVQAYDVLKDITSLCFKAAVIVVITGGKEEVRLVRSTLILFGEGHLLPRYVRSIFDAFLVSYRLLL